MIETSPFPFQGPLAPEEVTGREDLARDLAERLMSHRLTALLGPRRYGKTSLLKRVAADLAGVGPDTVWIDLYECNSMADLAAAVDRGLAGVTGSARRAFESVAGSLSLNLGVVGIELARTKRERPDPVLLARSLLQVLVKVAQRQPLLLVIDEFAGIADVEGGAGLLRTELQHHYRELGIVFAGSQPSTMRTLFGDQAQPFFAQADLVEIGPLPDDALVDIVESGFERTGRGAGALTRPLVALAEGHPQRAMQLADAAWQRTAEGSTADDVVWEEALAAVRATVDLGSERLHELLPPGHQKVLRVVAAGGSVYGTAASVLDLSPGTARGAVRALTGNGYLAEREGSLRVVDPLFADWIRRRFPV
ncbi:MAG: hypothetical protein JWM47_3075 [Acidimicrobiales bacterium]|nr:hypothetical protein [Acidimicrobiales bacterium]